MEQFTEEQVLIDEVRSGDSLAVVDDETGRRVLFQVENKKFRSVRQEDGSLVTTLTIESEPLPETGEPWSIDYPSGEIVTRILRVR
ncbi:hypothetical protein ACQ86B_13715 [Mycolicibacterium aichiense]|uniref:hypothetical protein n=1 Tax=Mycolicibacterium aichiense TaxID=1799 RepID=UPI003D670796